MKKIAVSVIVLMGSAGMLQACSAHGDDPVSERRKIEKYEKDIALDQLRITTAQSDLKTEQIILNRDIAAYGVDSRQVRSTRDRIMEMNKGIADQRADLQKDINKKAAQESGQVAPENLSNTQAPQGNPSK